jgi:hypothetical protein
MTPIDHVLLNVLEWLDADDVSRFLELAQKKGYSLSEMIVVGLRHSLDQEGTTPEEIQEAKRVFKECGLDWDKCI